MTQKLQPLHFHRRKPGAQRGEFTRPKALSQAWQNYKVQNQAPFSVRHLLTPSERLKHEKGGTKLGRGQASRNTFKKAGGLWALGSPPTQGDTKCRPSYGTRQRGWRPALAEREAQAIKRPARPGRAQEMAGAHWDPFSSQANTSHPQEGPPLLPRFPHGSPTLPGSVCLSGLLTPSPLARGLLHNRLLQVSGQTSPPSGGPP